MPRLTAKKIAKRVVVAVKKAKKRPTPRFNAAAVKAAFKRATSV